MKKQLNLLLKQELLLIQISLKIVDLQGKIIFIQTFPKTIKFL